MWRRRRWRGRGPPDGATQTRTLRVTCSFERVSNTGVEIEPVDLTECCASAWLDDGETIERIDGVFAGVGEVTIEAPVFGDVYFTPDGDAFYLVGNEGRDISWSRPGRIDAVQASDGTTLRLDVSGLEPWDPSRHFLVVESTGAGAPYFVSWMTSSVVSPMATMSADFDFDWGAWGWGLIDATAGDEATLFQTESVTTSDGWSTRIVRAARLPQIVMQDAQITEVGVALDEVTDRASVGCTWDMPAVIAHMSQFHPDLHAVARTAGAARVRHGVADISLFYEHSDSVVGDQIAFEVDNPWPQDDWMVSFSVDLAGTPALPQTSDELHFVETAISVQVKVPSTVASAPGCVVDVPLPEQVVVRIDGRDALELQDDVGETPRISWEAGAFDSASLWIYKASTGGGYLASITTEQDHVVVPPGMLVPNNWHWGHLHLRRGPARISLVFGLFRP